MAVLTLIIILILVFISEFQLYNMILTMHVYENKNMHFHTLLALMLLIWVGIAGWYSMSLSVYLTGFLLLSYINTIPYRSSFLLINNFTLVNCLIYISLLMTIIGIMGCARTPFLKLINTRTLRLETLALTLCLYNIVCGVLLRCKPDFLWKKEYDRKKAFLYTCFLIICIIYYMIDGMMLGKYQTNATSYILLLGGNALVWILMYTFLNYNYVFEKSETLKKEYEKSAVLMAQNHFQKEELMQLSGRDVLTNAYNRREISKIMQLALEENKPFICVFADLDGLKHINDTYGHSCGDLMLKDFAKASFEILGNEGNLARIGGDEFLLLFYNMTKEQVGLKMKNLQLALKEPVSEKYTISFSYGISYDKKTVNDFIISADKSMYLHKNQKRGV